MSKINNKFLAQMPTLTLKGNNTGGTANPTDLTVAQVNAILPTFTSSLNGLAPASGGGTVHFLRADGTWATPSGGSSTSYNFRAHSTSTNLNATFRTIVYNTVDFDSATAYDNTTGIYTIPSGATGKWQFSASYGVSTSPSNGDQTVMRIYKNGTPVSMNIDYYVSGMSSPSTNKISDLISCTAGDTIQIELSTSISGGGTNDGDTRTNYFSGFFTGA